MMSHASRYCGPLSFWRAGLSTCCLLLAISTASTVRGDSWGETQLLADAADGRLDQFTLLEAATIAGGAHDRDDLVLAERKLDSLWLEVGEPLIDRLAMTDRPRAIFSALHRLVLSGKYKAECTEVQQTLASGDYNCVTGTVLYLQLCRRHGLNGVAVAIPAHVYCRLHGKHDQDIQTTCRDWFEVQERKAASANKQGGSPSSQPRELTDLQLIGKVYYNRGVSHLEAHDYAGAIDLLKLSLVFDSQDEPARNNLLAAHNNWALALCDAGEYATAADKLAAGRSIDAQYGPLQTNDLYVHQKWVLHLCEHGRYSAAVDVLEQGYGRRPDAPLFDGGRYAIYGMWSRTLLEGNRPAEALAVLESARRRYGDHEELLKQEVQAFEAGIARLIQQGETAAAKALRRTALARHPAAESLRQLKVD
jgi:tetratricopeptide (TPR) repeat protein